MSGLPAPRALTLRAADGYPLAAHAWAPAGDAAPAALVIINCATAVRADYYHRYARYLAAAGYAALTYDYRGIGASRPASLRGFRAAKRDWGCLDFEAALQWAATEHPTLPTWVVAHSIGGFVAGLAPSSRRIDRMLTVGAQYGWQGDYAAGDRLARRLRWHLLMPLLSHALGWFPARRLGWHEDLPHAAALEWARRTPRWEDGYRRDGLPDAQVAELLARFRSVRGEIMAISLTDDPFGTVAAIERLLDYYRGSRRIHVRIAPADAGVPHIGHFAFFHERFRDTLWRESLDWLRDGRLARPAYRVMEGDGG